MPSISRINEQLKRVAYEIDSAVLRIGAANVQHSESAARTVEVLAKAQKALVETQAIIFVECTESDLDMPTLPLFVEERDESDSEE